VLGKIAAVNGVTPGLTAENFRRLRWRLPSFWRRRILFLFVFLFIYWLV